MSGAGGMSQEFAIWHHGSVERAVSCGVIWLDIAPDRGHVVEDQLVVAQESIDQVVWHADPHQCSPVHVAECRQVVYSGEGNERGDRQ